MVIHGFQNRSKSDIQRSHIFKDERIPENLNLLTFRVGNNLTSNVDLVREVKDIKTNIVCKVSIVNLLKWRKSKFNNMLNLFSCDSWNSSHDLIYIHLTIVEIFRKGCLIINFFHVFHGVGTGIGRKWPRLSDWVNMSHVSDWWYDYLISIFNNIIDFFISRICFWDHVLFIPEGVIWAREAAKSIDRLCYQ